MKRLFLLDAYALIFRSYYAFIKNPRITSKGLNTSAIFGFLLTLEEVLNKQHPTHMAVVFDTHEPTFRHIMYKEYKANRAETPEDILKAVPYIKKLLEAFRIPVIACPGYEADDVIGTLSRLASQKDFETYMMTPDKDYAQLVKENVYMFKPSRSGNDSVLWGVEDVKREFDVANHLQVIDILALMGDKVDNIPGAPGIGPKTASKLISEYGNVENIIANADKLKDKLQQTIKDNKDNIILSKTLATIEINVPIAFDEEDLQMCEPNYPALKALYEELEFRTFIAKLNANDAVAQISQKKKEPVAPATDVIQTSLFQEEGQADLFSQPTFNTIANTNHSYLLASSDEEIHNLVNTISGLKEFCFDTETTSISAIDAELVAISFSWKKNEGYLIRFDNDKQRTLRILEVVRPIFENKNIRKIGQNMKYDIQVLANYGIKVKGPLFDTMIAHYLLEPDNRHNMDLLSETYLNYTPIHIEELIGEKRQGQKNMRDIDTDRIKEYAVEDADVTFQLKEVFEPMLKEKELYPLFTDIEMPLVPVLAKMERNGVVLDTESLKSVAEEMRQEIISLEQDIYSIAGEEFNISSPRQLGDILFDKMKLDEKAKKTKTNQYFTNEEVLQHLKNKSPIVEKVLDYRGLKKLLSTYVEALPSLINPRTGRIHTSFNQAVAATGRLSSNNPNLQNIPIREERGRFLRKAFVPAKGCKLISVDYSQIELRLMAHLS
ncbi:MAG: DNA polymerase I, partial [Bacteroidales bacterium]|nr:DNA polymerase I [Bacteroidales bacterium]